MGWFSDFLYGTEAEAAEKTEAGKVQGQNLLSGVPIDRLYGAGIDQLMGGRGRADYQRAIGLVGQAGTGSALQALQRARQAQAGNRQQLAQRGLYSSSLATGADAGINAATDRTLAGIAGQTAAAQGGLQAGLGQQEFGRDRAIAGLYAGQADANLRRAGAQAGLLSQYQYQGQPGALGEFAYGSTVGAVNAVNGLIGGGGGSQNAEGEGGGGGGLLSSLCCFSAAAVPAVGADLGAREVVAACALGALLVPGAVREFRDQHAPLVVKRGYYRLAEKLVPRMRRPRVHALVRGLMVEPLTRYARWRMRGEGMGWVCWPAAVFWFSAFTVLGVGGSMRRSNGEIV